MLKYEASDGVAAEAYFSAYVNRDRHLFRFRYSIDLHHGMIYPLDAEISQYGKLTSLDWPTIQDWLRKQGVTLTDTY